LEGGQAKITCRNGHKTNIAIQAVKPEILSAIAGYAIIDGYYREAVTSFTAALERLYELYVHVVAKSKDVDQTGFENTWKLMSRQSERQYGAFAMLYLFEEGVAPKHLNTKKIAFEKWNFQLQYCFFIIAIATSFVVFKKITLWLGG